MSDAGDNSAILEDLEDLFSWCPSPFRLATEARGGSLSTYTREPAWYDKHLAPDRICKKIVHVKDLHRKVAAVVDEKLQDIRSRGIVLDPPTARGYVDKEDRRLMLLMTGNPAQNELSIQSYYDKVTSNFCIRVASTLALHPQIWRSVVEWTPVPITQGDAVCDGSLKLLFCLDSVKRERDQTVKHNGPHFVDEHLWHELMEVSEKYGDMAIWEMKSVSVGDGSLMLGIMALATGKEQFKWLVCKGGDDHTSKRKGHYAPPTRQLQDDPETRSKFGLDDSNTDSDLTVDVILDQALVRGGSSLERVKEFDRKLIEDAKGIAQEYTEQEGNGGDLESRTPSCTLPTASPGEATSVSLTGFGKSIRTALRKWSQDEQGSSSRTAHPSLPETKTTLPTSSHHSDVCSPKKGKLKIFIEQPFKFRRKPSQKRSSSKSPRKQAHPVANNKTRDKPGGDGEREDGHDNGGVGDNECERPLTAQSVLQQVSHP
jgi:hypothetical protein